MNKSRLTDSQIIEALKRAESGMAVPELCRERGISSATFYQVTHPVRRHGRFAYGAHEGTEG